MNANKLRNFIVLGALGTLWEETLELPISDVFTDEEEDRIAAIPVSDEGYAVTDEDIEAAVASVMRECYVALFAEEGAQSGEN